MIEPRKTLQTLQDRLHHRASGPSLHELQVFHDAQMKHTSANTLNQLKPVRMRFTLVDRRDRRSNIEIFVTGLEDFEPEHGRVRVIGLKKLSFIAIDYDITKGLGMYSSLKKHPRR